MLNFSRNWIKGLEIKCILSQPNFPILYFSVDEKFWNIFRSKDGASKILDRRDRSVEANLEALEELEQQHQQPLVQKRPPIQQQQQLLQLNFHSLTPLHKPSNSENSLFIEVKTMKERYIKLFVVYI